MYRWLRPPEWFSIYRGPVPIAHDYFTGEDIPLVPGSHWIHRQDRRVIDPIVIAVLLQFDGDGEICYWLHRISDLSRWEYAAPWNAAWPWCLRDVLHDLRPTRDHPNNWAVPTLWDRLSV